MRRTLPASSRWWMPTASSAIWKTFRKVRTLHCSRLRSVALTYDWSWWYPSGAIDRCSNIWASLPGAGYVQSEHKADSLIAKFKEVKGTVREIDVWAESRLSPSVICIIVCLSWAVNHYRDNAITYKAQRGQKCWEPVGERGNYWHADAQRDVAASMQNTRRS